MGRSKKNFIAQSAKKVAPKAAAPKVAASKAARPSNTTTSPKTSTASKTATSTKTATKTSTDAYTQGNITVTGGAGAGPTSVTIALPGGSLANHAKKAVKAKSSIGRKK